MYMGLHKITVSVKIQLYITTQKSTGVISESLSMPLFLNICCFAQVKLSHILFVITCLLHILFVFLIQRLLTRGCDKSYGGSRNSH